MTEPVFVYKRDPDLGARKPVECRDCGRMTAGRLITGAGRIPLCERCAQILENRLPASGS